MISIRGIDQNKIDEVTAAAARMTLNPEIRNRYTAAALLYLMANKSSNASDAIREYDSTSNLDNFIKRLRQQIREQSPGLDSEISLLYLDMVTHQRADLEWIHAVHKDYQRLLLATGLQYMQFNAIRQHFHACNCQIHQNDN